MITMGKEWIGGSSSLLWKDKVPSSGGGPMTIGGWVPLLWRGKGGGYANL